MLIELCVFEESVAVVFVVRVCAWVKKMHDNRCECVVWMDEDEDDAQ